MIWLLVALVAIPPATFAAQARVTLNEAGVAAGLQLSVFVTGFPLFGISDGQGPKGSAATSDGKILVSVSSTFSSPAVISGVRIIQHEWGITRVSGALGSGPGSMTALGSVFGPSGDVVGAFQSAELATQDFTFGNTTVP